VTRSYRPRHLKHGRVVDRPCSTRALPLLPRSKCRPSYFDWAIVRADDRHGEKIGSSNPLDDSARRRRLRASASARIQALLRSGRSYSDASKRFPTRTQCSSSKSAASSSRIGLPSARTIRSSETSIAGVETRERGVVTGPKTYWRISDKPRGRRVTLKTTGRRWCSVLRNS
jgi:hypothetical protein